MAEYCLRWNNHQPNLVTVFSELLTAESLVDVTLAADGHFIHAHRLVLSACSVYFKDLFNGTNSWKHPIVFLKDIRIDDLKTVVDFIYRGEVNVSQERLQDVLKTAESLRIKGLADKPFSYEDYPSQAKGQHLSSSFSSQRSSLTDSREQLQSLETEDTGDGSVSSPVSKKRKITSQDSSESAQDSSHENEEKQKEVGVPSENERGKTPPIPQKDKIKEESNGSPPSGEPPSEYQENRVADAMLLLQGSSSEGGAGDEGGRPPSTVGTTIGSSRDSGVGSLISSHSPGLRGKRGTLQRQTGIVPEGLTEDCEELQDKLCSVSSTSVSISSSTPVTSSSSLVDPSLSTTSSQPILKKHLQVPSVVVASHEKVSSFGPSILQKRLSLTNKPLLVVPTTPGEGQVVKQRSQPEMARSYSGGSPSFRKQPSQPSVLSHVTSHQESSSSQAQSMTIIPMHVVKKQKSLTGSISPLSIAHLRPIQPKPSLLDRELPLFQLTVSDEDGGFSTRLPRAISEEPISGRSHGLELLCPGPSLTQSVSQDTGLDGGIAILNRVAASSAPSPQTLGMPKLSSSGSSVAHSPVLREGPALGCNYCWNSQDNQGRVQRRKTKYHCPACRTNLCIVPCFHEYHSQMQMQQDQHKQFAKVLTKTSST